MPQFVLMYWAKLLVLDCHHGSHTSHLCGCARIRKEREGARRREEKKDTNKNKRRKFDAATEVVSVGAGLKPLKSVGIGQPGSERGIVVDEKDPASEFVFAVWVQADMRAASVDVLCGCEESLGTVRRTLGGDFAMLISPTSCSSVAKHPPTVCNCLVSCRTVCVPKASTCTDSLSWSRVGS